MIGQSGSSLQCSKHTNHCRGLRSCSSIVRIISCLCSVLALVPLQTTDVRLSSEHLSLTTEINSLAISDKRPLSEAT